MSKSTAEAPVTSKELIDALNHIAGRKLEYVQEIWELAEERGVELPVLLDAAESLAKPEVDVETKEQISSLVIPTGPDQDDIHLSTYDVFQGGVKVHGTRVIIMDGNNHDAWLDLASDQVGRIGEWLVREGQRLQGGGAR